MKIGIDVMGGDFAPNAIIDGALLCYKELPPHGSIVLIGPEEMIKIKLQERGVSSNEFEIIHAPDVIEMGDSPTKAFSQKPNASLVKGYALLKNNAINAFISAGNSGAMLVGAIYSAGVIDGLSRPAILAHIPYEDGRMGIFLDVGTNTDCRPEHLVQFAVLGSVYVKEILGIDNPKIGLINIGEEEGKGNLLTQAAYQLLKDTKNINFTGNIEGWDIFSGVADVLVCDGFTGNIILKQTEGIYNLMTKRGIKDPYFDEFNYEHHGGSPILGIKSNVILGHGISSPQTFKTMIFQAINAHNVGLSEKLDNAMKMMGPTGKSND